MTEISAEDAIVQQPAIAPAPVVEQERQSHTCTILEIVGGAVAVGPFFIAGAAGFVPGHVTARPDGRGNGSRMMVRIDPQSGGHPSGDRGFECGEQSQRGPGFLGGPGAMPVVPGMPRRDPTSVIPEQGSTPQG